MERLTVDTDISFCDIAQCREMPCPYDGACDQRRCYERLREYERTGLTPEEVTQLVKDWSTQSTIIGECGGIARIRELAEADVDGRVVVLPCKVGDTVYFSLLGRSIEKRVVTVIIGQGSRTVYCAETSLRFQPCDIGKTVFLAREEAEKALEVQNDRERP